MTDSRTTPAHLQAVLDAAKIAHDAEEPHGGASNLDHVVFPFAFDTPGIVIPASGPAGIKVTDLNPGDVILGTGDNLSWLSFVSVQVAFNGTHPNLYVATTPDRGNLPGVPPQQFGSGGLSVVDGPIDVAGTLVFPNNPPGFGDRGAFDPTEGPVICRTATSLWVWLSNGLTDLDPGATQGEGEVHLFIERA